MPDDEFEKVTYGQRHHRYWTSLSADDLRARMGQTTDEGSHRHWDVEDKLAELSNKLTGLVSSVFSRDELIAAQRIKIQELDHRLAQLEYRNAVDGNS